MISVVDRLSVFRTFTHLHFSCDNEYGVLSMPMAAQLFCLQIDALNVENRIY